MKKISALVFVLLLSACGAGSGGSSVTVPAATEVALSSGKNYYQNACASCHGADPTYNSMNIRSNGANNPSALASAFTRSSMSQLQGVFSTAEITAIAGYIAAPTAPPGGLFVGYYQDDSVSDPTNPVPGALYAGLADGDTSDFSGKMVFSYLACQSPSNFSTVGGSKTLAGLNGSWTGNIDSTAQNGTYSGTYDAVNGFYSGTYTVAGGTQNISVPSCIDYTLADKGSWNIFPLEKNIPASFALTVSGNTLNWSAQAGSANALVNVLDLADAVVIKGTNNAVKAQVRTTATAFDLATLALTSGRQYLAAVSVFDANHVRVAAGSKRFTAP
jgi:cytochrome c553